MSDSSSCTKRPNQSIAKAAHAKWKEANDRYLGATAADRELIDRYNKASVFERPDYNLVQEASKRIDLAQMKLATDTRVEQEILNAWKPIRQAGDELIKERGVRYANATLDNYLVKSSEQTKIVKKLRDYAKHSSELVPKGTNVILLGPKGTGKDHLLMGLAKEVLSCSGFTTKWENGCNLHQRFREQVTTNRPTLSSIFDYAPDILWISDPLPPTGVLSEFQQAAMFSLVDSRYSNLRPTWITINVENGDEAEKRMGAQTVDRLRHGALVLFCNWPSFRQGEN